jgi:hypothetical protein
MDEPKLYKVRVDGEDRLYERNEEEDLEHFWYSFDAEMRHRKDMMLMMDGGGYHPNYAVLDSGEIEQLTFSMKVVKSKTRFNPYKHYSGQYLGIGKRAKRYFPIEETSQYAIDRIVKQIGQDWADEELEADVSIPDDARIFVANYLCPEALEMVLRGIPVDPAVIDRGYKDKIIDYPKADEKRSQLEMIENGLVGVYTTKKEYLKGVKELKNDRFKWMY